MADKNQSNRSVRIERSKTGSGTRFVKSKGVIVAVLQPQLGTDLIRVFPKDGRVLGEGPMDSADIREDVLDQFIHSTWKGEGNHGA